MKDDSLSHRAFLASTHRIRHPDVGPYHKFDSTLCHHLNRAHNARMSSRWYNRRWMAETVFSSIKRTLGSAVHARSWQLEFREMVLKCAVYNLRQTVRYP